MVKWCEPVFHIRKRWIGSFFWYQKSDFWHSLLTVSRHIPRRRQWHPTPVLLPGKSHGQRSLVGCSPWGHWELDTTEWLHFHFSLSRIGEGNGNPLQCSCLENARDRGAWWAAVYGVAQSRTRLKRLSSSSSFSSWSPLLPPSSLLDVTLWTSLGVPQCGELFHH